MKGRIVVKNRDLFNRLVEENHICILSMHPALCTCNGFEHTSKIGDVCLAGVYRKVGHEKDSDKK